MPAIEWSDIYLIGVPDLDADHRRIVALFAELYRTAEAAAPPQAVVRLIDDLLTVVLPHMAVEHRLMSGLSSPSGIEHRAHHHAGHRQFIEHLHAVRADLARGRDCRVDLDRLEMFLTLFELICVDYEMVGELRREGLLAPDGRSADKPLRKG